MGTFHPFKFDYEANHYGKVKQDKLGKLCQIAMRRGENRAKKCGHLLKR